MNVVAPSNVIFFYAITIWFWGVKNEDKMIKNKIKKNITNTMQYPVLMAKI